MVGGSGFDNTISVVITRPDATTITIPSDRLRNVTAGSFEFLVSFVVEGTYTIRVDNGAGQRSNAATVQVAAPTKSLDVGVGTTNSAGQTIVSVPAVGDVAIRVTDDANRPLEGAFVAVSSDGVAVEADGYEATIVLTTPARLRAHIISLQGIVVSLRKGICKLQGIASGCTGADLASGLGTACEIADVLDRGLVRCAAGPDLHADRAATYVAQALVLNYGSVVEKLLSRIPLVGCALTIVSETTGFDLNTAYLNLLNKWYPELQGSTFLVLNKGGKDLFTPFVCPKPTQTVSSGTVSEARWTGTVSWYVSNTLITTERVKGWSGNSCDAGATAFDEPGPRTDWRETLASLSASQAVPSVRRSTGLSVPAGIYSWWVETTRPGGSVEHSDCQRLNAGSASGAPALSSIFPTSKATGSSTITVNGAGFNQSTAQIVVTGPGCANDTACVIPNQALTTKSTTQLAGPLTLTSPGTYTIRVQNGASGPFSNGVPLAVSSTPTPPTPESISIANISPTSATVGTFSLTVNGTGFDAATAQVVVTGPGCATATACVVPNGVLTTRTASQLVGPVTIANPGTFTIQVQNGAGGPLAAGVPLNITPGPSNTAPSVSSIGPNPVPTFNADQNVQVFGTNFQAGLTVDVFNSGGAKIATLSGTQIQNATAGSFTMTVNLGSTASTFGIEVVNPGAQRSARFNFSTTAPAPTVSSINPNPVPVFNGNQNVQVFGSSFQAGLTVDVFNSSGTKIGTLSGTQVQGVTPGSFTMVVSLGGTPGSFGMEIVNPSGARSTRVTFSTR